MDSLANVSFRVLQISHRASSIWSLTAKREARKFWKASSLESFVVPRSGCLSNDKSAEDNEIPESVQTSSRFSAR